MSGRNIAVNIRLNVKPLSVTHSTPEGKQRENPSFDENLRLWTYADVNWIHSNLF